MIEFGAYEVIQTVAAGSTGTVYKAWHREIHRTAAIKELSPELRNSAAVIQRFRTEAHVLAGFDDPHIVTVYDFVEEPGRVWIAEEWVDGVTIETLLGVSGPMTPEQSLGVLRGALLGLSYAHDRGIVHGDLAPSNIIADQGGVSKLIDFGVSAPVGSMGVRGTPAFLSPEVARGEPIGKPADVYSAGAVLFSLLTGHAPFPARTVDAVLQAHMQQPPPPLSGHGPAMAALLADAMAKDPNGRPPDARAFLARMEDAASERYGADWLGRASIAGAVGAVTAAGGIAVGAAAGGGSAATATAAGASSAPTAFVEGATVTGVVRKFPKRSALIAGVVAGLAVVGVVIAFAASGGGSKRKPAAHDIADVAGGSQSASPSSAAPSVLPHLAAIPLSGVYTFESTIVSTTFDGEKAGPTPAATWSLDLTCGASKCTGTIKSSSGRTFRATFDGETFTVSRKLTTTEPCVYTSGPDKNKPAKGTLFRQTTTVSWSLAVVSRAPGPTPAAGTALELKGPGHGYSPRGKVIKGTCSNDSHVSRDVLAATMTYVSS